MLCKLASTITLFSSPVVVEIGLQCFYFTPFVAKMRVILISNTLYSLRLIRVEAGNLVEQRSSQQTWNPAWKYNPSTVVIFLLMLFRKEFQTHFP